MTRIQTRRPSRRSAFGVSFLMVLLSACAGSPGPASEPRRRADALERACESFFETDIHAPTSEKDCLRRDYWFSAELSSPRGVERSFNAMPVPGDTVRVNAQCLATFTEMYESCGRLDAAALSTRCNHGDARACFLLGAWFEQGTDSASVHLEPACRLGHFTACLVMVHRFGWRNFAFRELVRHCDEMNIPACARLADFFEIGTINSLVDSGPIDPHWEIALELLALERACGHGIDRSCVRLSALADARSSAIPNLADIALVLGRACKRGIKEACSFDYEAIVLRDQCHASNPSLRACLDLANRSDPENGPSALARACSILERCSADRDTPVFPCAPCALAVLFFRH